MMRQPNYILAYQRRNKIETILSTDDPIYSPNIENQTPYSPTNHLDTEENEWFYIDNFRGSNFNIPITTIGREGVKIEDLFLRLTELNQFASADYPNIRWLITMQGACYYFQKVLPSIKVQNKTYLVIGGIGVRSVAPQIQEMNKSVEVRRECPDIIYDATTDRLIFKDLSRAKDIYPNLADLYREATDDEVNDFFSERIDISVSVPFEIGVRNRKEVARLLPKIRNLSDRAKNILTEYIDNHIARTDLQRGDDGKIIISTPTDLKNYIALLDERFITSEIYSENRLITAFTSN